MASNDEEFNQNIKNLKDTVKLSFSRIYASLKARELKTLRQLEAIQKQCQGNAESNKNCVQNITISYENESTLLDNINKYGAIDLEKLNFDNSTFTLEDYVSPNDDHMYSYKCIANLTDDSVELEAIEEAALKQITSTDDCVCFVNIRPEDVSKRFRDCEPERSLDKSSEENFMQEEDTSYSIDSKYTDSDSNLSEETKKIDPTDDWLNSIKGQTETEPSQSECLEHSKIACS